MVNRAKTLILSLFFIAFFAPITLFGADLMGGVKDLLGDEAFEKNKNKITQIFANKNSFLDKNANLDYEKIIPALRANGLINLSYKTPVDATVTFKASSSKLLAMQLIKESLGGVGYGYWLSKKLVLLPGGFEWEIAINTQFVPGPAALQNELKKYGVTITNIKKMGDFSYIYELDTSRAKLKATSISRGEWVKLPKPFEPYFLDIYGSSGANIKARPGDLWVAIIKVFDRDLNLLLQIRSQSEQKELSIALPPNAYYMAIDDVFSLENIRYGLDIFLRAD